MQKGSCCCPIGSEPALSVDYKPLGKVDKFGDLPVYLVGSGEKAIIVAHDIYGFDGGRTKLICDQLADAGFNVILPDFYRGNPWPEDKELNDELYVWASVYTNESIQKDLSEHVFPYLEKQGAKSIGMLGFCWGAWVVFNTSSTGKLKCGVSCHPTLQVVDVFKGSQIELTEGVKCPQAMFPAGNDPDKIKEDGEITKMLEEKFLGKILVKTFPDVVHGFVSRGDLKNKETARDVKEAMTLTVEYFNKYL